MIVNDFESSNSSNEYGNYVYTSHDQAKFITEKISCVLFTVHDVYINGGYNKEEYGNTDYGSAELVELLFSEFYTRISNVEKTLNVTRKTASSYLNQLVENDILIVEIRGRDKLYINSKLVDIVKYA